MIDRLLTDAQVARLLGTSRKALAQRRWRGGGPRYVKLGRRVLYDPADLEAWIQQNKRSDTSDPSPLALSASR